MKTRRYSFDTIILREGLNTICEEPANITYFYRYNFCSLYVYVNTKTRCLTNINNENNKTLKLGTFILNKRTGKIKFESDRDLLGNISILTFEEANKLYDDLRKINEKLKECVIDEKGENIK